jgi:gluconate 2-dehydrogenase gamma chain
MGKFSATSPGTFSRRDFFKAGGVTAAALAARAQALPLAGPGAEPTPVPAPAAATKPVYIFFSPHEAAFIEAAVDRLIPPDANGPGAVAAGVPQYLDRQLGGAWGAGERLYRSGPWQEGTPSQGYQLPYTPAELFRHALRAIISGQSNVQSKSQPKSQPSGGFAKLPGPQQDAYLESLQNGAVQLDGVPGKVFFESLLGMTIEGYFSDPIYGGNRDMAAWKMIGFPGAYASFYELVDQHDLLYRRQPMSIGDRDAGQHGDHKAGNKAENNADNKAMPHHGGAA